MNPGYDSMYPTNPATPSLGCYISGTCGTGGEEGVSITIGHKPSGLCGTISISQTDPPMIPPQLGIPLNPKKGWKISGGITIEIDLGGGGDDDPEKTKDKTGDGAKTPEEKKPEPEPKPDKKDKKEKKKKKKKKKKGKL